MARRENAIPPCSRSLRSLATWLREGRDAAALTYEQLAARTEFSADTLARAASGRSVPQNPAVVLAYAAACERSTREAERLWKHARRDEARAQGVVDGHRSGVHISVVKDFADLHSALVDLHHDDGRPPLRSLDARAGGIGRLPHSTVGRVLKGRSTPSRMFVAAFAEACNVRRSELPEWTKAWDRADADRRSSRLRSRRPDTAQRLVFHDRVTPRDLQLLMSEMESTSRRAPALKLTVHVPDPASADADAVARMSRELLIDQAQRRGELACPRCRRPSFGFSSERGWTSQLCSDCAAATPSEAGASAPPADAPTLVLRLPGPGPSPDHASDTPTLSLRVTDVRPPLPRRQTTRTWPQASAPHPTPALNAATITTLDETPGSADFFSPRVMPVPARSFLIPAPAPAPAAVRCPLGDDCPDHGEHAATAESSPGGPGPAARPLTTRIRINVPGSRAVTPVGFRPIPRVVVRRHSAPATARTEPRTPPRTPAPAPAPGPADTQRDARPSASRGREDW
ncbi:helix-turn-helix domain-containing protein [Streptomyces sp. NPDC090108]|uniref:helix-turn-helix domain-containing protein n=1 Tax=Streptomyces sp. NPDC090108 TaxID=3365947 RepID=UPI00382E53EC